MEYLLICFKCACLKKTTSIQNSTRYKNDIDESWMKRTRSSWPQEGAILADFWVFWIWNNENKSCLNDFKFWEVSGNLKTSKFWKLLQLSLMWNPEIFQDAPTKKSAKMICSFDYKPQGYLLSCFGCICLEIINFIQIGSGH